MQELYISPDGARYPNPDKPGTPSPRHFKVPTRILTATLLVALGMARPVGTVIREVLR